MPVLRKEVDTLRAAVSEEIARREDDLHLKDGEVAMLKAKVRCSHRVEIYEVPFCVYRAFVFNGVGELCATIGSLGLQFYA